MNPTRSPLAAFAGLLLAAACSSGTGPGTGPNMSLSFSSRLPAGMAAAPSRAPAFSATVTGADTLTDGANTLIITSAKLVLRKIQLKRQDVASQCGTDPEPAGCEDFEVGPVLVELPLTGSTDQQVAVDIPSGRYTEVQFTIHKVTGDAVDSAFVRQHPEFLNKSIRVQGTYNGAPFTYESDLDVDQKLHLDLALVVTDTTISTNLTIRVVLADWFKSSNGALVNPTTANVGGANEGIVKENIKNSMKAFEDADKDGDERNS